MKIGKFLLAGVAVAWSAGALYAADPAKVALVEKGELKEAKASWWGFNAKDSTDVLQKAINSKVPKLIIDKQASPWIVRPLFGVSNQTIVFEEGVELLAKEGEFKDRLDCMIRWENVDNVKAIGLGKGAVLRMRKADYQNKELYTRSEWRHVLTFWGCKNILVENLTLASSGGDGLYLNKVTDAHVKKVICDDNHRQGLSIITGENILVEDSQFINTRGTSPQSGVDVEPNKSEEGVKNIVFRNCRFANNARWGLLMAVAHINSDVAGDIGIRCENCVFENNEEGEYYLFLRTIFNTGYPVTGKIELLDSVVRNDRKYDYLRPAVEFSLDTHHEVDIVVKNLTVTRGPNREKAMRFGFHFPNRAQAKPAARVTLENVKFTDCSVRDAIAVMDNSLSGATDWISGDIVDKDGKKHEIDAALVKRAGAVASPEFEYDFSDREVKISGPADGEMEKYPEIQLHQYATYWFYCKKGQKASFLLRYYPKVRFSTPCEVKLIAPDGTEKVVGKLAPGEDRTFTFEAAETGFYKAAMRTKDLRVALIAANVPAGIVLNEYTHRFTNVVGTFYFDVPENAKEFAVRVWGQVSSRIRYLVKAEITDPDGKVVFRNDGIGGAVQYTADQAAAKPGIWKVRFDKPQVGGPHTYLGYYNLRFMGVCPYIGLREDRTPVLGKKISKLPTAKTGKFDAAYF